MVGSGNNKFKNLVHELLTSLMEASVATSNLTDDTGKTQDVHDVRNSKKKKECMCSPTPGAMKAMVRGLKSANELKQYRMLLFNNRLVLLVG